MGVEEWRGKSPSHSTEYLNLVFWPCLAGPCLSLWLGVILANRWLSWPLSTATNSHPQAKETSASLHVPAQILLVYLLSPCYKWKHNGEPKKHRPR